MTIFQGFIINERHDPVCGDCETKKIKESPDKLEQQSPEKSKICILYSVRWLIVPRDYQRQYVGLFERAGERYFQGASWQTISSDQT